MSDSESAFDRIIDALAQGETYAYRASANEAMAGALSGISDGADERIAGWAVKDVSGLHGAGSGSASTRGPGRGAAPMRLIVPRPSNLIRVMSVAVVAMMCVMTAIAALIADAVEDLTSEVESDTRFNRLAEVVDQPVSEIELRDRNSFEALLMRWPDRVQRLWLKRFQACRAVGHWDAAVEAYREAALMDRITMPPATAVDYAEVLIAQRQDERAARVLDGVPVDRLDAAAEARYVALVTRLHLATVSASSQ